VLVAQRDLKAGYGCAARGWLKRIRTLVAVDLPARV
jgi:hypothetical protein